MDSEIRDIPAFPDGKQFRLIYADPAWQYNSKKTGGSMKSGASQKYSTMTPTEICNLPVKKISDPSGSVLFLWVTTPLKYEIATSGLLESWGYEYKTTVYWRKLKSFGVGYWFRGVIEECWLCTKGKVKPFGLQIPNYIQTEIEDHSKKPKLMRQIAYDVSEEFNLKPRIELFSRDRHEGWSVWGNQAPDSEQKVLKEEYLSEG